MSWADTAPPVTLAQIVSSLRQEGSAVWMDFTCPKLGPHPWTSATIPHVRNQHCPVCGAKKAIPVDQLHPATLRGELLRF